MCNVAGTWNDFFNSPGFIANDLRFSGFKIDGTAHAALLQQGLIHVMQIQQVRYQRLALRGFNAARIGQDCRDFGIGKACLA